MKELTWMIIIAFAGCLSVVVVVIGLGDNSSAAESKSGVNPVNIRTQSHDGHMFIISGGFYDEGVSMIHHPGCKCLKEDHEKK